MHRLACKYGKFNSRLLRAVIVRLDCVSCHFKYVLCMLRTHCPRLIGRAGRFLRSFSLCSIREEMHREEGENAAENENHEEEEVLYLRCSWSPLSTDRGKQALLAIRTAWPYFTDSRVCLLWSPLCSSCASYSVFKTRTTALFLSWGARLCTPWPPNMFIDINNVHNVLWYSAKKELFMTIWRKGNYL